MIQQILHYLRNPMQYVDPHKPWAINPETGRVANVYIKPLINILPVIYVGSGCFADVFWMPDGRVCKITRYRDKAYDAFAQFARNNCDRNPCLPRIDEIHDIDGTKKLYVMELLTTMTDDDSFIISQIYDHINKNLAAPCPHVKLFIQEFGSLNLNDIKPDNMGWRGEQIVFLDPTSAFHGLGVGRTTGVNKMCLALGNPYFKDALLKFHHGGVIKNDP